MLAQILMISYLSVAGFAFTVDDCPSGLKRDEYLKVHDDTCYEFVINMNERRNFQDAQNYCTKQGGNLAIVKSESIDQYLKDTLKNSYKINNSTVWIGLKLEMDEFTWVDGSKFSYSNINPNDNDIVSNLCASLSPRSKYWETYRCTSTFFEAQKNRFVCQYQAKSTCPVKTESDKGQIQELGNKCYYFGLGAKLSYPKASAYCNRFGGSLVLIKSKEINDFIQNHLTATHKLKSYSDALWIGLKYNKSMDAYLWSDSTPMVFNNFNNYGTSEAKCATISPFNGKWNRDFCTDHSYDAKNYICEFDKKSNIFVIPTLPSKTESTTRKGVALTTIPTHNPPTSKKGECNIVGRNIYFDDVKVFENKCYYFGLHGKLSFSMANAHCKNNDGRLALVKSKRINDFLQKQLTNLSVTHKFKSFNDALWIGLKYNASKNAYLWTDNTPVVYNNFNNFVRTFQETCGTFSPFNAKWNKAFCTEESFDWKNYICEFDKKSNNNVTPTSKTGMSTGKGLVLPTTPTQVPLTTSKKGCFVTGRDVDDDDVTVLDNKCYTFVVEKTLGFFKARLYCQKRQGALAMPKSERINQFLVHHLRVTHKLGNSSKSLWIGLSKTKPYYPFTWVDGTTPTYTTFKSENIEGDCAAISPFDGDWEAEACYGGVTKHFICEFERKKPIDKNGKATPMTPVRTDDPSK